MGHWHPAVGKCLLIKFTKNLESKIGFVLAIVKQVQLLLKINKLMKRKKEALGDQSGLAFNLLIKHFSFLLGK